MSIQHHSAEEQAAMQRLIDEIAGKAKLKWPSGQISPDDKGETAFAIAADHKNQIVRIQFSKPMVWLGMNISEAMHLRNLIDEKITELASKDTPQRGPATQ